MRRIQQILLVAMIVNIVACKSRSASDSNLRYATGSLSLAEIQQRRCQNFVKKGNCLLRLQSYKADEATLAAADAIIDSSFRSEGSGELPRLKALKIPTDFRETKSIFLYTASAYREMNAALRGDEAVWQVYQKPIYAAASGLNKLVSMRFQGLVYRTETVDLTNLDMLLQTYKPGSFVLEAAFMSTSKSANLNFDPLRPHLMQIYYTITSKTGVSVKFLAQTVYEDEVLFVPGSVFKVTSLKKKAVPVVVRSDKGSETSEGIQLQIALEEQEIP